MEDKNDKKFPDAKRLKEVRDRLSREEVMGSSLLPENASEVEKAKYKACEMMIRYRRDHDLKQKELAIKLGIDEARMSEILHYKIENFTLDRLVGYAQTLYPNLKLNLVAA